MKKIILCVIFLLLSINIFCHNTSGKCLDSMHSINKSNNDSISEEQLITEISVSENGDTTFSYRYNKFDYGELANGSFSARNAMVNSEAPVTMSISSEPIDQSKYVGNISFTESVTPTGAKIYSIPITTYINSFAPELSLTYNSQAANGAAGYAWSIAGLSAIYAENKSIYYDENVSALDLSNPSNCAFSLDGSRLIRNSGNLSGEYQYETAQGFILVKKQTSGNAISYFTAKFPNGSTARYGFVDNVNTKHVYPITEIEDMKGYIIKFEYVVSGNNYIVSKIKYGGKKGAEHLAELNFTYADRIDCAPTYIDGLEVSYNKLLKSIVSCNTHNGVLQEIGTYTLTHQLVNNINQLAQLDYSIGSTYMNPIKMKYEYYDSSAPQLSKHTGLALSQYFTNQPVFIRGKFVKDRFNDGIITFPGHSSIYGLVDGYNHILGHKCYEYGSLFPADQQILVAPELNSYDETKFILAEKGFQNIVAIDYNSDGTDEIVKINFNGVTPDKSRSILKITKYTLIDLNNGSILKSGDFFDFSFDIEKHIRTIDINGDGKTELCYILESKTDVYSFSSSGYSKLFESSVLYRNSFKGVDFCGDLNGDGKMDILRAPQESYLDYKSMEVPVWGPKCLSLKKVDS